MCEQQAGPGAVAAAQSTEGKTNCRNCVKLQCQLEEFKDKGMKLRVIHSET